MNLSTRRAFFAAAFGLATTSVTGARRALADPTYAPSLPRSTVPPTSKPVLSPVHDRGMSADDVLQRRLAALEARSATLEARSAALRSDLDWRWGLFSNHYHQYKDGWTAGPTYHH